MATIADIVLSGARHHDTVAVPAEIPAVFRISGNLVTECSSALTVLSADELNIGRLRWPDTMSELWKISQDIDDD